MDDKTPMDVEAIVRDEPEGKKLQLRVWLRLLSCANLVSAEIRKRLREEFDVTLPRFDLLSQLYREPDGLRLGELSRRLMVTNGNLTGLVDRLVEEKLVIRETVTEDRRAIMVKLSKRGERSFAKMAVANESWLGEMFVDADRRRLNALMQDLEVLKNSVIRHSRQNTKQDQPRRHGADRAGRPRAPHRS
jgi:DNA-binding MarR family transcriptional regulator